jgi:hypothetical protein
MSHMPYFLRFAKNNLHLELGVGCLYSPSCREERSSGYLPTMFTRARILCPLAELTS